MTAIGAIPHDHIGITPYRPTVSVDDYGVADDLGSGHASGAGGYDEGSEVFCECHAFILHQTSMMSNTKNPRRSNRISRSVTNL